MDVVFTNDICHPARVIAERYAWNSTLFIVFLSMQCLEGQNCSHYGRCRFYGFPPREAFGPYRLWQTYNTAAKHGWAIDEYGFNFDGDPPATVAYFLSRQAIHKTGFLRHVSHDVRYAYELTEPEETRCPNK